MIAPSDTLLTLITRVGECLVAQDATLSVAESLTGGLLGACATEVPGASRWFAGGVIVYQTEQKHRQLNLASTLLEEDGPVSEASARTLAQSVRERFGSTYALAVTGVAGPDSDEKGNPVGCVYIGLSSGDGTHVKRYLFDSTQGREGIRRDTVEAAFTLLYDILKVSCRGSDVS